MGLFLGSSVGHAILKCPANLLVHVFTILRNYHFAILWPYHCDNLCGDCHFVFSIKATYMDVKSQTVDRRKTELWNFQEIHYSTQVSGFRLSDM